MFIIDAPHFYAAVLIGEYGRVERSAPIVAYMLGWTWTHVIDYCARKNWKCSLVAENGEKMKWQSANRQRE